MRKFTMIAEYRGGTYVSQHYAETVDEAIMIWAENLNPEYFQENEKRRIIKDLKEWREEFPAATLDGLTNVWYQHIQSIYNRFVHLNIVETV